MNDRNKFLLPDKSLWQAFNSEQREALVSKYTILCPPILFAEIVRHGEEKFNALLNRENIIWVPHWLENAKMDLLTEESAKSMFFGRATPMKLILESSDQELLAFEEVSGENIEMLKESEAFYRNLDSIIKPLTEGMLNLLKNTDNLSDEEWVDRLKEVTKEFQGYYPEIERILNKIETDDFPHEVIKNLQESLEAHFGTYNADTLENAYQIAARMFDHEPIDWSDATDKLHRLCWVFRSILTPEEHTHIFNRFVNEDMPPISRFAPYALNTEIWNYTIQFYLRENPKEPPPKDFLRDAEYLHYTYYKGITFVSGDKWHRKFVDEVPLFEGVRENFVFVDTRTKEGLSKII